MSLKVVRYVGITSPDGVELKTGRKYCRHNFFIEPKIAPLKATKNGKYLIPTGYAGHGQVDIEVPVKKESTLTAKNNGSYQAPEGTVYSTVNVEVPIKEETTLFISKNGTYVAPAGKVYTSIVVNVPTSSSGGGDDTPSPDTPTHDTRTYNIKVGESFSINYGGSSPSVECPSCLEYQDDGGVLVFTGKSVGYGTLRIYDSDTLLGEYTVTVDKAEDEGGNTGGGDTGGDTGDDYVARYEIFAGESFSISYEGSSPTVDCPKYVEYYDDGGELVFTGVLKGSGTIYIRDSDTVIGTYYVVVKEVESFTGNYSLTVGETFELEYHGSSPTVECPTCLTYQDDGGLLVFTGKEVGTGVVYIYNSDTLIGKYSVTVKAADSGEGGADVGHKHTYTSVITEATCTTGGYTTHICACGDSYKDSEVEPLGHSPGTPQLTNTPTCTVCAHYKVTCTRCSFLIDEYDDDGIFGEHDFTVVEFEPTCTEAGYTRKVCKVCNEVQNFPGEPALGHDYQLVVDSNQSSGAAMKCTRCGDSYEADYDCSILGHETSEGEYDMEDGSTAFKCKHCGEFYQA